MYHKTVLENGVTILTEEIPHVRSVVLGVWVEVGSRDEAPEYHGLSHFIEHLFFKGTHRRTASEIAESLEAVGGQLNAFTTKEYTCYYARVLDEHFDLAADVLTDMFFNSRFAKEDLEREKNVVLEEIKMYEDTPDELVHDVFASTLWQGHPLGRPVLGRQETVRNFDREAVLSFYERYYLRGRVIVAAAGHITHQQVVDRLSGAFAAIGPPAGGTPSVHRPVPHREVTCRTKDTEQVHLCLGTAGLSLDHEQLYVLQVVNTVLGGGLSSRLFQQIRERRGLAYSVYSYHSSYRDSGIFGIYAGLSKENTRQVLELICREVLDLSANGLRPEELRRAKDQLKGGLLLSLESVSTRMSRLAKSELYLRRHLTPEEVVERIERVTDEDVRRLAADMLRPEDFSIAVVGPWNDCTTLHESVGRVL